MRITLQATAQEWLQPVRQQLLQPLLHFTRSSSFSSRPDANSNASCDVRFVCGALYESIHWNGLPYLASLSSVVKPRPVCGGDAAVATVLLPDYEPDIVAKLLLLLSMGAAVVTREEIQVISKLAKDIGVRAYYFDVN